MTKLTEGRHEILASIRFHRSCGKGCEEWVPRTLEGGGRPGMGPGGRCPEEGDFELGVQGLEGNN